VTAGFALHPWAVEILHSVGSALEGETDGAARQAACYLLALLLQSLGVEALTVLPAQQLTALYRRLKIMRDDPIVAHDELLQAHVASALQQMTSLGHALVCGARDAAAADSSAGDRGGRGHFGGVPLGHLADSDSKEGPAPLLRELAKFSVRMP